MDRLQRFTAQFRTNLLVMLMFGNLVIIAGLWLRIKVFNLSDLLLMSLLLGFAVIGSAVLAYWISGNALKPKKTLWQAILHVSPGHSDTPPPNLEKLRLGRELITALSLQVYQLAASGSNNKPGVSDDSQAKIIASSMPLHMFVLDKGQNIVSASDAALKYINRS